MGVYNTIAGAAQRRGNLNSLEKIQTIAKEVTEIHDNIEKMAEVYSKGNMELKQKFIEIMHKKIETKIEYSYNPLKDQLDIVNSAIIDYFKIKAEISDQLSKKDFITDPFLKQELANKIDILEKQSEGKMVLIHDTISSINSNIYIAKSHVQEAIEQLRRNGNNFRDSFYKYIEDFNN
jgi:hypothetical protein